MSDRRVMMALVGMAACGLISWVPDWSREDWPRQVTAHGCSDIVLPATAQVRVECGANNVVAAIVTPVDSWIARRLRASSLWTQPQGGGVRRASATVSIAGEFVIVEKTTCGACARVMGTTWLFRPGIVAASTLEAAQAAAGLRATQPLRTVDAWRAARP